MKKSIALLVFTVIVLSCCALVVTACDPVGSISETRINLLADSFSMLLLGNDAYAWNVFSVTPEQSYGYVKNGASTWYSYTKATKSDMDDMREVFEMFEDEIDNVNPSKLSQQGYVKYCMLDYIVSTYVKFYSSPYALDFNLIGGSYINAQGGYVADFASMVDNYAFRNKNDIIGLLEITNSTRDAFATYLNYAGDRVEADYPLYDYSLTEMKSYLDTVLEQGENYYLYALIANKINAVDFLSAEEKQQYISQYRNALTNKFMVGVRTLSEGLDSYKGYITHTWESYLSSYGRIGELYYAWQFEQKTGIKNVNVQQEYLQLQQMFSDYSDRQDATMAKVASLQTSAPSAYADFQAYVNGEKALLGLETPEQMLEYLKTAAKQIVPDLNSTPQIYFRQMDDTVAEITSTLAYYLHSPLDDLNSPEYITLNSHYIENNPDELLLATIAHEGYPGHLYAYVSAKENGSPLISAAFGPTAFAEGWAVYVETVLLSNIANSTSDQAVKLYCEYYSQNIVMSFITSTLLDMQVNYFGVGVSDLVDDEITFEHARSIVELLMENPTMYLPYGYGVYVMLSLHDMAKTSLGANYNEVEFNRCLLSEGTTTLPRAKELANNYIYSAQNI